MRADQNSKAANYAYSYPWRNMKQTLNIIKIIYKIMFKEHRMLLLSNLSISNDISNAVRNICSQIYLGHHYVTIQDHVTSPVTWPFDTPGAICYRCSIVTTDVYKYSSGYRTGQWPRMLINILWHLLAANQYGGPIWRIGAIFSCSKGLWDCLPTKPITSTSPCFG